MGGYIRSIGASTPSATGSFPATGGGWPPSSPQERAPSSATAPPVPPGACVPANALASRSQPTEGPARDRASRCTAQSCATTREAPRTAFRITTAARTLLDLAAVLQPAQLQRTIERAEALRLTDRTPLDELLTRYPNRRGTRALREILRAGVHADRTRNDFERDFLAFLEAYGLPRPVVNGLVEGFEVDFHWPAQRLIVEVDGRETHDTSAAFERDRERDRKLVAAGWRPTRLTWRQFNSDAPAVAEDLASALSLRPSAPRVPHPATPSTATGPASGRGRTRGRSPSSRSSS
jgi:hypothetical protein